MNNSTQKIIDKIMQDAMSFEETAFREAETAAGLIRDDYKSRSEYAAEVIVDKSRKNAERIVARAEAEAELVKRNGVLAAKSAILDDVFNIAAERIISSDDALYLELMIAMAIRALEETGDKYGEGVILMNKNDADRFGAKLVDRLSPGKKSSRTRTASVKLTLSKEHAGIRGGFIIRYDDIDVNCSVESVVASMRHSLEPQIIKTLFE